MLSDKKMDVVVLMVVVPKSTISGKMKEKGDFKRWICGLVESLSNTHYRNMQSF